MESDDETLSRMVGVFVGDTVDMDLPPENLTRAEVLGRSRRAKNSSIREGGPKLESNKTKSEEI